MKRPLVVVAALLSIVACKPTFSDDDAIITEPRVIAVRATPAEAAPPALVAFDALYVDASGTATGPLDWSFCVARKSLTDLGTMAPACLAPTGPGLVPVGSGLHVEGPLPMEGCRLFGPDFPPATPDQPSGRPVDPDPSGGYYQPVHALAVGTFEGDVEGTARIACGVSGADGEQIADYGKRYVANQNPVVEELRVAASSGTRLVEPGVPASIARAEHVTFTVAWPTCAEELGACGGAETYLVLDRDARELVEAREPVRVAWFATGGHFDSDRTGREGDDPETSSDNGWTAPDTAGVVHLWVVLRDDRGGAGWQSYDLQID